MGPTVINEVKRGPCKWPYKWVTGVVTAINGVRTPLKIGRGPQTIVGCGKKNQPFLSLHEQLAGDDPLKLPSFCWVFPDHPLEIHLPSVC